MKQEAIDQANALISSLQQQLIAAIRSLIEAENLPEDPVIGPSPANLRITESYGGGESSLYVGIGVDQVSGLQIDYRGHPSDPNGPQEWTSLQVSPIPNELGSLATLALWPSSYRRIEIRASGVNTETAIIEFTTTSDGVVG